MSDRVTIEENVVFGRGGARELTCDVFRPASGTGNRAGLLLVHGGAWQMGDRSQLRAYGIQLGREGFTCVASSYRLTPESPWPAQIHDVKAALRFMRARAEWLGIEPDAVAALGASAGGHLALLAAGTVGHAPFEGEGGHPGEDASVRAVVGIFPPTILSPRDAMEPGAVPALALVGDHDDAETSRLASPMAHVTPQFPPTLLLHGNADKLVPAAASMRMYEALIAQGVPAELHMVAEQPHAYVLQRDFHRLSVQTIALFLRRYLGLRAPITLPSTVTGGPPR
jgi:acetyl esterase/lipase